MFAANLDEKSAGNSSSSNNSEGCTCHSDLSEASHDNFSWSSHSSSSTYNVQIDMMHFPVTSAPLASGKSPQIRRRRRRRHTRGRPTEQRDTNVQTMVAPTADETTAVTHDTIVRHTTDRQPQIRHTRSLSRRRRNAALAHRRLPETKNKTSSALTVMLLALFFLWRFHAHQEAFHTLMLTFLAISVVAMAAAMLICLSERIELWTKGPPVVKTASPSTTSSPSSDNHNTTTERIALLQQQNQQHQRRRKSSMPRRSLSPNTPPLNSITEHKMEDEYDYWWEELDSQTQYFALLLGYTPQLWDADYELEDLECEDLSWEELTKEQQAAATFFGYTEQEWDEDSESDQEEEEGEESEKDVKIEPVTTKG